MAVTRHKGARAPDELTKLADLRDRGVISLLGGIVVTAFPTNSVTVLAVLAGIWFIVQGLFEIIGAFMFRRTIHHEQATMEGAAAL